MLTNQDLSKLQRIFATKQDLAKLESKFNSKHEQIITMLDSVMGELKAMREESSLTTNRQSAHSDQLENHEGRITHIESCLIFPN